MTFSLTGCAIYRQHYGIAGADRCPLQPELGLYCTGRILRSMAMGGFAPSFMAK
ncbi:hypothetical protein ACVXHB_05290 [Escherichia coli]